MAWHVQSLMKHIVMYNRFRKGGFRVLFQIGRLTGGKEDAQIGVLQEIKTRAEAEEEIFRG